MRRTAAIVLGFLNASGLLLSVLLHFAAFCDADSEKNHWVLWCSMMLLMLVPIFLNFFVAVNPSNVPLWASLLVGGLLVYIVLVNLGSCTLSLFGGDSTRAGPLAIS